MGFRIRHLFLSLYIFMWRLKFCFLVRSKKPWGINKSDEHLARLFIWVSGAKDIEGGACGYQQEQEAAWPPHSPEQWKKVKKVKPNALIWTSEDGCVPGLVIADGTWVKEGLGISFFWRWRCGSDCFHLLWLAANRETGNSQPFSEKLFNMEFNATIFKNLLN